MDKPIVLVVDDKLSAREAYRQMLKCDYEVVLKGSGAEALEFVKQGPPHAVLLDIKMPDMDGIEVLKRMKEICPELEVVMVTAYASLETAKEAMKYGAVEYLIKPASIKEVREAIRKAVSRRMRKARFDEKLLMLLSFTRSVTSLLDEGRVLETILEWAERFFEAEMIWLYKTDTLTPELLASKGELSRSEEMLRAAQRIATETMERKELIIDKERGTAGLPLIVRDKVIGAFVFKSPMLREEEIGPPMKSLLTIFSDHAAIALENARLYAERKRAEENLRESMEKLKNSLNGIIQAMALAVEMRDPFTAGHQRRVAELACAIAGEMGLPEERIEAIRMAGMIHDLGKISVPAEILTKSPPSKLTEAEFALIKNHPQVGYEILKEIDFPYPIAQIVLQHHERMDGSGYPQGLRGDQIMLEARIIAVADVVEAMVSHRPYRPPLGIEAALKEISRNKGALYDPDVVEACLKLFEEGRFEFNL